MTADGFDVVRLRSQDGVEAAFAPGAGLACCSLWHGDEELLAGRHGLAACAEQGVTMGLSLLHPWPDHLSAWRYRALGTTVKLPVSPLLRTDASGLPVNGVQGGVWEVREAGADAQAAWLHATLPFDRDERRLALFPFPHVVHVRAVLRGGALEVATEVEATGERAVPVCFGFRAYLRRGDDAAFGLPARTRLVTDARRLPTGTVERRAAGTRRLADGPIDELLAPDAPAPLSFASGGRGLTLEALEGFPLARVRATADDPDALLEALTAEPDALNRGSFARAEPGRPYRARFRIAIDLR